MNKFKENSRSFFQLTDQLISHYQIPYRSYKKETLDTIMAKIDQQERNKKQEVKSISWFIRAGVAAAALVAALVTLYFFTATVNISADSYRVTTCRLPDDSRVVLQRNSSLNYSRYFWQGDVKLTGAAYFEVTKGNRFNVKTDNGSVEVLGTRFMVDAGNRQLNVECYQGSVKATWLSGTSILEPGNRLTAIGDVAKSEKIENNFIYPEFAIFRESFSNAPLSLVCDRMESFFGVTIDIQEGMAKNFSGTIHTGSLRSALEIVCESLQLKFKMTDRGNIQVYN